MVHVNTNHEAGPLVKNNINMSMIQLIPFKPADFKKLISWLDNEELLVQVAGPIFSYPLTAEQLVTYLADEKRYAFKVIDPNTNEAIGHAELYKQEENVAKICRVLIGNEAYRGKGLGQELMNALVSYAINELQVPTIELNVYDWNVQAIRCYEKVGFVFVPEKYTTIKVKGDTWKSLNMIFHGSCGHEP